MKIYVWFSLISAIQIHLSSSASIFQDIIPDKDVEEYGLALEAVFGMGLRLQALLNSTSQNFVVSPLSATVIVGQLLLGAEGEFRDKLYELLSLNNYPQHYNIHYYNKDKKNESSTLPYAHIHLQLSSLLRKLQRKKGGEAFTLKQSNALFYNENLELKKNFERCITRFYDTEIKPLDFENDTTSIINDWAYNHTNGLIKTILASPPGPSTSALFLNSIYFQAEWKTPFSDELNKDDIFHINENNTIVTTYMMGFIEQIPYVQTKEYRLICLPYKNNDLGMYIIYPNQDNPYKYDLNEFSEKLDPAEVLDTITKSKMRNVVVKIPKLSLSNRLTLLEPLQKYAEFKKTKLESREGNFIDNIEDNIQDFKNFTPEVTRDIFLSGAAENSEFKVSDIVQQMIFSINEKGTEAAVVTAGITDYMGGTKTLVLNRPFTFFIRHEATLATIFWGTIIDPSKN